MVRIDGLFHLLINGVYWAYNPLILNIDPNFLDIQVFILVDKIDWVVVSNIFYLVKPCCADSAG